MKKFFKRIKKNLSILFKKKGGRNNHGIITIRHRGGGFKRRHYNLDFLKYFFNLNALVIIPSIQDIFRTSFFSGILYKNGVFAFILKPKFLIANSIIDISLNFKMQVGSIHPLRIIPEGVFLHSVEFKQGYGSKISRSAGTFVFIISKFNIFKNKILLKLRSKEEYLLNCNNLGTIGRLDNIDHNKFKFTKAGDLRNRGFRPFVRGVAMNPIDHPHGGNTSIGRQPVSFSGCLSKGGVTRKKNLIYNNIYKTRKIFI